MRTASKRDIVMRAAAARSVIRAADVVPLGVSPQYLNYLARRGALRRVGRGLYVRPDHSCTEYHSLAEVAAYAPRAVVCLLSALQFHCIGTQMPHAVWIAVPNRARSPKAPTTPVQTVRMGPVSLSAGVETHLLEGVPVRVFSSAKTVADCFKFRSLVGPDVAIEALREGLARRRFAPADLYEFALINRVWEVMRPYVEALQ